MRGPHQPASLINPGPLAWCFLVSSLKHPQTIPFQCQRNKSELAGQHCPGAIPTARAPKQFSRGFTDVQNIEFLIISTKWWITLNNWIITFECKKRSDTNYQGAGLVAWWSLKHLSGGPPKWCNKRCESEKERPTTWDLGDRRIHTIAIWATPICQWFVSMNFVT